MYYTCVNDMCNTPKMPHELYMYHTCNTGVTHVLLNRPSQGASHESFGGRSFQEGAPTFGQNQEGGVNIGQNLKGWKVCIFG